MAKHTKEQDLHHHYMGVHSPTCKRCIMNDAAPEMLEALKIMTALCAIKYGNLDKKIHEKILTAGEVIAKAEGRD